MSSHKKISRVVYHKTPPADAQAVRKAELLAIELAQDSDLGIADDADQGHDPYNSTGQHLVPGHGFSKL